jgi:alkylation response protein AidB-like acyl-CoA dehydrogenase
MQLRYSEEQSLIQEAARGLMGRYGTHDARLQAEASPDGYDPALWQAIVEMGWLEAADGDGGNFETLAILNEELGRVAVATPLLRVTAVLLLLAAIAQPAAQKLRDDILKGGSLVVGAPLAARGRKDGDTIRLDAEPQLVEWANAAKAFVVLATLDDGSCAVCVVARDTAGAELRDADMVDNIGGAWLRLCDVTCAAEQIITTTLDDAALRYWNTRVTLLQAAEATASAQGALDLTLGFVKDRTQFGRAIGSFQAIQHGLADVKAAIDAAWLVTWEGVAGISVGEPPADQGGMAGWLALRALERAAVAGSQFHGGIGMVREYPMQYYYRRAAAAPARIGTEWDLLGRTASVYVDNAVEGKKSAFEV